MHPHKTIGLIGLVIFSATLQAREFNITFDVNVYSKETPVIVPYIPGNWDDPYSPEPLAGSPIIISTTDNSFSPVNFQYTINFNDDTFLYGEDISYSSKSADITIDPIPTTPFTSSIPENPNDPAMFETVSNSGSIGAYLDTGSEFVDIGFDSYSIWGDEGLIYDGRTSKQFFNELFISYFENDSNTSSYLGSDISSIDGLIALLNQLSLDKTPLTFYQGYSKETTLWNCDELNNCKSQPVTTEGIGYNGTAIISSINEVTNVPAPASLWLFSSALIGLAACRKKY